MDEDKIIAIFLISISIGLIAGILGEQNAKYEEGFLAGRESGFDIYQQSIVTGLVRWTSIGEVCGGGHIVDGHGISYIEINHGNWSWCDGWWDFSKSDNETFQIQSYLKDNFKNGALVPSDAILEKSSGFGTDRGYGSGSYYRI